jgi:LysR family glycine cleavage system transcriptional activator
LRAFEAAARHLRFTRAAAELNVTQTAISHQTGGSKTSSACASSCGDSGILLLTRQAQQYLPAVRAAFADLRLATDRLLRADGKTVLTVSCLPSLAAKWLVPRLAAFQESHPDIEVRIATSTNIADFRRDEVDLAIRYGSGRWPGLRADWLMAEDVFPVCSPALLTGDRPLGQPEDLVHHTLLHVNLYPDEWLLWLTAAGLPSSLARGPGLTFDLGLMALQAAIGGLGVALGRTPFVEADIAAGRLAAPFKVVLPSKAGFYVVMLEQTADTLKIAQFRDWLIAAAVDC